MRMKPFRLALAGALVVLALCSTPAVCQDIDGLRVTSIYFQDHLGNPWPEPESLLPLAKVRPGDRFSREAVRTGIGYLYLKGLFRDVRVDAFPEEGGVRLAYTLFPITIVEKIILRGNHSLSNRSILETVRGIVGRELREETFPDIRSGIQARYQAEGFPNVRVTFQSEPSKKPNRAYLVVQITESRQTIIEQLRFKGNTVLKDQELLEVMKNRPGKPLLTDVLLEADREAIQRRYGDAGYPLAKTGPVSVSFQDNGALIEIEVTEGPKVTVTFTGNRGYCADEFSDLFNFGSSADPQPAIREDACDGYFRGLLLFWQEHDVSETVIESSAEKIRNAYRDRGYADVKIDVSKTEGPGTLDLAFHITEGPRISIAEVRVEGTRAFDAAQIEKMMGTRESGWIRTRPYREDVLDRDVEAIADLYDTAGYLSARVERSVSRTADGRRAIVVISVSEGKRTMTGDVLFEGNEVLGRAELLRGLKLVTGTPFNERVLEEDRFRILTRYADQGYLYTQVEAERYSAAGGTSNTTVTEVVDIRYRISEERQVRIGTVILRGNAFTKDAVILRELEPKTGEPYNYEAILKSQQRVYRYGYFSLARFEPVRGQEKEYEKDMLFTVEERPAGAVEIGIGYGDLDRLRGFVEVSHRNLWSEANYASLRLEGSDILQRSAFTYRMPWFFGYRYLESVMILAWSDAKRINQDTREVYYQTRKTSASYGIERALDRLKLSLTYQFENVENYNVQPAAELSPDDSGRVRISSLSPAVIWDLRDNPFDPHQGSIHGITVKEAMKALGSQADFTKATVQTTWFFPAADRVVLALSGRAGMAWPHYDTIEVPIHERFYLGGSTTVRGYIQDSVGPQSVDSSGNTTPTGGSSMVQLNAEVRFGSAEGFGIVCFSDAGNVWVDQHIRLDDLRASYGAGVRYHTPVGPLRIDYGQKVHRRPGESPGELHFTIGHAF
jgi:outer membrane protein insertion porin family